MISFKPTLESDLHQILELYNYHVLNTTTTFHLEPLSLNDMKNALPLDHDFYKTYTIFFNGVFCGYCYLNNWKPRQAYNRSAELTLYLSPEFHRKGIGKACLSFLELEAHKLKLKNLIGVITYENKASIALFEKMGYIKVGHLKNIGKKFNRLLDVVTYQKEL